MDSDQLRTLTALIQAGRYRPAALPGVSSRAQMLAEALQAYGTPNWPDHSGQASASSTSLGEFSRPTGDPSYSLFQPSPDAATDSARPPWPLAAWGSEQPKLPGVGTPKPAVTDLTPDPSGIAWPSGLAVGKSPPFGAAASDAVLMPVAPRRMTPLGHSSTVQPDDSLSTQRARLAQATRQADPVQQGLDAASRYVHGLRFPRAFDYLGPIDPTNPASSQFEVDQVEANIPDAHGTRPARWGDVLNPVLAATALIPEVGALANAGKVADSLDVLKGSAPGFLTRGFKPAPGLPLAQAAIRGVRRFNPEVPEHILGAKSEEELANIVQGMPDEQVVRWGDPIGSHGADVISVNKRTADVTLWDSKYRDANVSIQHSRTFTTKDLADGQIVASNARDKALAQAIRTIRQDQMLPPATRQKALENLKNGMVKTRTVGFGNAKNSRIGN